MSNHILKGTVTVSVKEYRNDGKLVKRISYTEENARYCLATITILPEGNAPRVTVSWAGFNDVREQELTAMARLLAVVARRARSEEGKV